MSGGFPLLGSLASPQASATSAAQFTTITSSGSANTKGSWGQLIASTLSDTGFLVFTSVVTAAGVTYSIDLGIGPAGSEVIIAADIMGCRSTNGTVQDVPCSFLGLPISIPAGTRIAARMQSSGTTISAQVTITLFDTGFTSAVAGSCVDAIGFNAASTLGTAITPNIGSKSAFVQLIAATSYDYSGIIIAMDDQNGTSPHFNFLFDVAVGASGSERIIVPNYTVFFCNTSSLVQSPQPITSMYLPIPIPAGTRISARGQVDSTAGGALGMTLYGVR